MRIDVAWSGACYEIEWARMAGLFYPGADIRVTEAPCGAQASASAGAAAPVDITIHVELEFAAAGVGARVRAVRILSGRPDAVARTERTEPFAAREQDGAQDRATSDAMTPDSSRAAASDRSRGAASDPSRGAERAEHTERTEPLVRRAAKRASLHALHEAFRTLTGRSQPWGILTGVRPTKLAHARLRAHRARATDGEALARTARDLEQEFLVSPERARLTVETAERQLRVMPDLHSLSRRAVSVYLGVPFCPTHCAYCTFPAYSMREKAAYAGDFLAALEKEILAVGSLLSEYGVAVTSVYVGGGTPTSLRAPELQRVLEALLRHLPGAGEWREFCVEAGRADTITPDRVAVMRELGVDRVSVNPQTYRAATLRAIRRGHSPEIIDKRFRLFREAGFTNINMDLIMGLPGEDVATVADSVSRTLRLAPDSVTLHTLSFKRSAAVTGHRDDYAIPDDGTVVQMMDHAKAAVEAAGLRPYYLYRQKDILANLENVGYAQPGKEGVYNISIIEEAETIVAVGGGGASKWVLPGGVRAGQHKNPREPRAYVETIDAVLDVKLAALRRVCEAIQNGRRIKWDNVGLTN